MPLWRLLTIAVVERGKMVSDMCAALPGEPIDHRRGVKPGFSLLDGSGRTHMLGRSLSRATGSGAGARLYQSIDEHRYAEDRAGCESAESEACPGRPHSRQKKTIGTCRALGIVGDHLGVPRGLLG